jgi:hypothetical protein
MYMDMVFPAPLYPDTSKKTPKKPKQNKIYSKINIDKGYLPSSIYVDRGGNIGLYKF